MTLASVIFHDCDLLPPDDLAPWYLDPPRRGKPVHLSPPCLLASPKYSGNDHRPGCSEFFGGVTAVHPADFEECNGFPNDLWGWCHEDDQLLLRLKAAGRWKGIVRPPESVGLFTDMDPVDNYEILVTDPQYAESHIVNEYAQHRSLALEPGWAEHNGLNRLYYKRLDCSPTSHGLAVLHMTVELPEARAARWPTRAQER